MRKTYPLLSHAALGPAQWSKVKADLQRHGLQAASQLDRKDLLQAVGTRRALTPAEQKELQGLVARRAARMPTLYDRQLNTYLAKRRYVANALRTHSRQSPGMAQLLRNQQSLYGSLLRLQPSGAAAPPQPL